MDSQNNKPNNPNQSTGGSAGGNNNRRRRYSKNRSGGGGGNSNNNNPPSNNNNNPTNNQHQGQGGAPRAPNPRRSNGPGRVLTTNQVLVKYDNLLEQHLITRKKYFEYYNRVDERQLYRLEKNFYDSIEHLRRFESSLEPWQREVLEKRKTERYRPDLTYSNNREWDPEEIRLAGFDPDANEDPHFKESQKEAMDEYKDDTEESSGTYEDYLKIKGQA